MRCKPRLSYNYVLLLFSRVMLVVSLVSSIWLMKVDMVFYKQINMYNNHIALSKQYQQLLLQQIKNTPVSVTEDKINQQIQQANHRTAFFIWLKCWADDWFTVSSPAVKQLSIDFNIDQQLLTVKWQMILASWSVASIFLGWLHQAKLFDDSRIVSMQPESLQWQVHYMGNKVL